MTSYSFSQRVDAQVILWAIGGALCRLAAFDGMSDDEQVDTLRGMWGAS